MAEIPDGWKKKEKSDAEWLSEWRRELNLRHRETDEIQAQAPNTGDVERDRLIMKHRNERIAINVEIARVKGLDDGDPEKVGAISAVRATMAAFNESAKFNSEYWTDAEIEVFRSQGEQRGRVKRPLLWNHRGTITGATIFLMTIDEARSALASEGYVDINEWHDAPEVFYPPHAHGGNTAHVVVSGSLFVTIDGEEKEYKPGDRFNIPAHVIHSARMGGEGCTYIFGEKLL
jgi:mannose-6-phosphate isomerase-like protein (cupin superfamily)